MLPLWKRVGTGCPHSAHWGQTARDPRGPAEALAGPGFPKACVGDSHRRDGARRVWAVGPVHDPSHPLAIGRLEADGEMGYRSSYLFSLPRDIEFPAPCLQVGRRYEEGALTMDLASSTCIRAVAPTGLSDRALAEANRLDLYPDDPSRCGSGASPGRRENGSASWWGTGRRP